MTRNEKPFAPLIGERLTSVEFVAGDYVQIRFSNATLNAYNPPLVRTSDTEHSWGDAGYRDALCERINSALSAGWASENEIVLELSDGAALIVSLRPEDTDGPEPAEFSTPEDWWVWQAGIAGITHFDRTASFVKPS